MNDAEVAEVEELAKYQRRRRIVIGILLLVMAIAVIFIGPAWSGESDIHENIEMAGIILIVSGILGRLWCILYIGGRKSGEIVDTGPYSLSRNPLYVFSAIAAAGAGAQMGSLTMTGLMFVLCVVAFYVVIFREEDFLRAQFGAPYLAYLDRVPRFLPNFLNYKDTATLLVYPKILRTTLFDGIFFFVALPFFELIEDLQASGAIPVLFELY